MKYTTVRGEGVPENIVAFLEARELPALVARDTQAEYPRFAVYTGWLPDADESDAPRYTSQAFIKLADFMKAMAYMKEYEYEAGTLNILRNEGKLGIAFFIRSYPAGE